MAGEGFVRTTLFTDKRGGINMITVYPDLSEATINLTRLDEFFYQPFAQSAVVDMAKLLGIGYSDALIILHCGEELTVEIPENVNPFN